MASEREPGAEQSRPAEGAGAPLAASGGVVLVTGGAGYLGSRVVARLAEWGVRVVSLDVRPPRTAREGVVELTADLRTVDLAAILSEHDVTAVVHLAAIVEPPPGMSEDELADIEVGGTRRVLDACVVTGVGHLTVTSSGAAYGYHARNDGRLLTEDEPVTGSPEFAYSRHKAQVEALLARARRIHPGLGQLVLRPGTILGASTDNQITALFTGRVVLGLRGAATPFTFVWDEDVAEIITRGVLERRTGIYNVAGVGVLTLREIATITGARLVRLPPDAVRLALAVGRRLRVGRYGPEQVDFLRHRPVQDVTRLQRDFPGLPSRTSREVFEIFLAGRAAK